MIASLLFALTMAQAAPVECVTAAFANGKLMCEPVAGAPPVEPPVTPPPVGAFAGCPADALKIDNAWGKSAIDTGEYGSFGGNILVVRIAVPLTATGTSLRTTSWVEYAAGPVVREAVLSTKPCDFTTASAVKNAGGSALRSTEWPRFSFNYRLGAAGMSAAGFQPGQVYYLNVRNRDPQGNPTCSIDNCRMRGSVPN